MEMAWNLHKLTNLLDCEENILLINSQIFHTTDQLIVHNGIRNKITLCTTIFHINFHRENLGDQPNELNPRYICVDSRIYSKNLCAPLNPKNT